MDCKFKFYMNLLTFCVGKSIELELMKERFSKLLLGEDMSGGGKGVATAVTISNSITNLYGKSCLNFVSSEILLCFLFY